MSLLFVLGCLPPLEFDAKPDTTMVAVRQMAELNLSNDEMAKVRVLLRWIDLSNIEHMEARKEKQEMTNQEGNVAQRKVILKTFDPRGNFFQEELKHFLSEEQGLPDYLFHFLAKFESAEERQRNFSWLVAKYFEEERKNATGALREILQFEHEWRIVIAGYLAKKYGEDLGYQLRFEDPSDPFVQMTLAQKDTSASYVFPLEYRNLEALIHEAGPNPTTQMKNVMKYRFDFYAEMEYDFPFNLRRLLAYFMQLMQLEEMMTLKQREGEKRLMKLMEIENAS